MAKPWSEVAASPEYTSLPADKQEAARNQYFKQVVAPNVPAGKLDAARAQFDEQTKPAPGISSRKMSVTEREDAAARQPAPAASPKSGGVLSDIGRQVGLTARAAGPQAAGALLGGAAGSVIPGVGTVFGAGAGLTAATVAQLVDSLAGTDYLPRLMDKLGLPKPATKTERIAQDVAGSMAGTGGLIRSGETIASVAKGALKPIAEEFSKRPLSQIISSAAGGATAGEARERGGKPLETMGAGFVGSILPAFLGHSVSRVMHPIESFRTPEHQELIGQAEQKGFKLTAGQKTGNERLMAAESTMRRIPGGGAIQELGEHNKKVLGRRALDTIGESGDAVTPQKLSDADKRIGAEFGRIVNNRLFIPLTGEFQADVDAIEKEYVQVWGGGGDAERYILAAKKAAYTPNPDVEAATPGINGEEYKRNRTSLQRAAVAAFRGGDANKGRALAQLADALDDAAQRAIPKEDYDALVRARSQWRNLIVLEDATTASAAGRSGAGSLEPNALMTAVVTNRGRRPFAKSVIGQGDELADLARLSNTIRDLIPTSGTAERMYWMHTLGGALPAIIGGGLGEAVHPGAGGGLAGYAAGLVAPYATTKTMMTEPMQAWLSEGWNPDLAAAARRSDLPYLRDVRGPIPVADVLRSIRMSPAAALGAAETGAR